jgi:hypothetical protein
MPSSASCAPEHKVFLWFLCSTRYTLPFVLTPARSGMQQGRGVLSCAGNSALQHSLGPVVRASAKQLCET